ncbi:MAG: hypothetical protein UR62_C0006G0009 [Candidatus Nomurabacteria bacterium GW2011_GWF2_35_12]|uniref:Uncharacterized protein n=3 Tax=Candidatus Nomuraibacteriota TaxID=1752729 RepID=A0A0G0GCH8_9BACT|nr:MAG: hypothetical protein UR62_C0006G0009 [Candidatus Nomurabacteria bacterium GW2011_GWF2_35_12]KKP72058.1 MAG: hypothetical protein UR70_C0014G0013 [Candidatus Nomurabacteria bacterium GW2011_GWB1_35_20]KKP76459.1 MAG: hypothetical protein UR72_C0002G0105 [Parcubacteria group bacterium GW2011_GWC1_35_21]KKP78156.1 MAG: hypothetical protein UR77_C0006G0028 [Candidatus Nomurabacteria bacterium GW2011_GWC2_35_35]KKP85462.1 MAG: hypothetical protein UR86_C0002G0002 [Parcubacteria group bacteri
MKSETRQCQNYKQLHYQKVKYELKKIGIILFLIFSLLPIQKIFAQDSNTGFVSGNIWYSQDPFEEEDKIKIYTFIFNPDSRELSGTVIFFDKTVLLGKKEFTLPAKTANDISIDWTVTVGDHTIFAKIENAKFLVSKGKYEEVYLAENETEKNSRTVSKKIISKENPEVNSETNTGTTVSDIKKIIEEKTPNFIAEPIVSTVSTLEEFRINTNIASDNKKEEIKSEIKILDAKKTTSKENTKTNPLLKPLKYVEVFLLTIFSLILNNKILFYGFLIVIVFFILRFIWKKIF